MTNVKLLLMATLALGLTIACHNKTIVSQPPASDQFRVLGYLPARNNWVAGLNAIDLTAITDLNLAFINPDSLGNFPANDEYGQVVEKAHAKNVRVFISIGGGSPPHYLAELIEPGKRTSFITNLVATAEKYQFDGVDVDLENALINDNYASFVSELSTALKSKNKLMTAALASWNANLISVETMRLYDFINIMSYDKTGPWNLNKPGQHSPLSMAQDDFIYFNQSRGIAAEKLSVGLPFYGYGFGPGAPQSLSYKNIIVTYPGSEQTDSLTMPGGGKFYYNGMNTIRQKVSFAIQNKAGGVMIWQLLGDSQDEKSLLKAINDVKNKK